jgi:hypothetical protein
MRLFALALFSACSFTTNPIAGGMDAHRVDSPVGPDAVVIDGPVIDGPVIDGPVVDAPQGCYGAGSMAVCLGMPPQTPLNLDDVLIDTDACIGGESVSINGTSACALAGTDVSVGGLVRGEGSVPLVLVASGSLTIGSNALLDVSSSRANGRGAGANPPGCADVDGGDSSGGGGGGAGGSFGTAGGAGGAGATAGGDAAPARTTTTLIGGCSGGDGGDGMGTGGPGGAGGGAVYVLARTMLRIDGNIDASGAGGGAPNTNKNGGGGGGAGGMIALWSGGTLLVTGELYANGGGGAGGSESVRGQDGRESPGADFAGSGGAAGGNTGDGGDGAIALQTGAPGSAGSKGGGGGGGGVGVIRNVSGQTLGGKQSPPAS